MDNKLIFNVYSVDAWREPDGGWTQNATYATGETVSDGTPRQILRALREAGLLTDTSKGHVFLDEIPCDPPIIDVCARGTREPLFTLIAERETA